MKKRILAGILVMAMAVVGITACGSSAPKEEAPAEEAAAEEAAPAEEGSGIDKIVFATNPEFPPFEYVTTNGVIGEFDGIDMAIAVKIGEIL